MPSACMLARMSPVVGKGIPVRFLLSEEPTVLFADDGIEDLTGHPARDFVSGSVNLRALFHADDEDLVREIFHPSPTAGAATNVRLRHRDGRLVCVRCAYTRQATDRGLGLELELRAATGLRSIEDRTILTNFIAMMENSDDYIYFKDRNHVFTGASQTLVRITDPSEHWTDLIGRTDYDVFPEEYADRYYSLEKRIFAGHVDVAQETQPTLDNDGKRGWVDNRKYPIRDAGGNIIGLFGVARDITATKVAEDALREALERLQKIARLVPGVVYQYLVRPDGSSCFPYMSEAVRDLYGVSPEAASASAASLFAVVHPDDQAELLASVQTSARELSPWVNEHRVRFPDGTVRYMFGKATPQRQEDGSVLFHGFVGDITDATERKRAEADLRIAATAFESRDGMIVTDAKSVILKVNRAFTGITGYSAAEAVGKTPELLRSDRHEPTFYEAIWASISCTGTWQGNIWQRRKSGSVYPAWLAVTAVTASAGEVTHYVWTLTDETERRKLEEQLYHSQKLEAIGQLAGGVAHDFNNLLAVILSYSSLAIDALRPSDPLRDDISEVKKAAERARTLTQQLLAFSRKQVLEPRTLDLNQVVIGAEKMLRRLMGENIELLTVLAPEPGLVRADPSQVDQVIMNLAINARDAMPSGGSLTLRTAHALLGESDLDEPGGVASPGAYVELSVTDTGSGIDPGNQARVFEPFFTTKEKGKGTGLGLSTVYGIVKQSGGTIRVSSKLGVGTTFKIFLPRTAATPAVAPSLEGERVAAPGAETVLLVEDEDAVRAIAKRILEGCGYTVLTAANGEEALSVSQGHAGPIHLLLTDVVMAKLGGPALAARLSASRPATRVLFISGHTDDRLGRHGVLEEGTNFLGKPFTPAVLAKRVRAVLDAPRATPPPQQP